jgi:uncharacterized protein YndB with AHSA1/START domain
MSRMAEVHAHVERTINAPVERVRQVIADYPRRAGWLPDNYSDYHVEDTPGGPVLHYRLKAGNSDRAYAIRPSEAGNGIEERDTDSSLTNRWTLTPRGDATLVAIDTSWEGAGGIGGFFERLFAPAALSKIHQHTLDNLARRLSS